MTLQQSLLHAWNATGAVIGPFISNGSASEPAPSVRVVSTTLYGDVTILESEYVRRRCIGGSPVHTQAELAEMDCPLPDEPEWENEC